MGANILENENNEEKNFFIKNSETSLNEGADDNCRSDVLCDDADGGKYGLGQPGTASGLFG